MADANIVRQKVQQARELAKQGKYTQAKALLKGIDHPKVKEMVAQLDERIAAQPSAPTGKFPLIPVLSLVGIVAVFLIGGGLLLSQRGRGPETLSAEAQLLTLAAVTPTIPTGDCTDATVNAWWQVQIQRDSNLSVFKRNASAASSTMRGEALTTKIDELREIRTTVLNDLPTCASPELQTAVQNFLISMDPVIEVLDRWNKAELDGLQLSNEYYAADRALNTAELDVIEALP